MKTPTQSANIGPSYLAGLHLHEDAVQNPCRGCGDLRDRALAGLLTGACLAVGGAAVRLPASRRRAASRTWRVISARVRSRAPRSTDDRSCSVWLVITPCRAARSIAKLRPLHPVSTWTAPRPQRWRLPSRHDEPDQCEPTGRAVHNGAESGVNQRRRPWARPYPDQVVLRAVAPATDRRQTAGPRVDQRRGGASPVPA
jgi:hypothetical protein